MRQAYFALKFFHENVLHEKFDEKLPLTKSKQKLPVVLNRTEIREKFEARKAGIKKKVMLHTLRHSFTTHLLEAEQI